MTHLSIKGHSPSHRQFQGQSPNTQGHSQNINQTLPQNQQGNSQIQGQSIHSQIQGQISQGQVSQGQIQSHPMGVPPQTTQSQGSFQNHIISQSHDQSGGHFQGQYQTFPQNQPQVQGQNLSPFRLHGMTNEEPIKSPSPLGGHQIPTNPSSRGEMVKTYQVEDTPVGGISRNSSISSLLSSNGQLKNNLNGQAVVENYQIILLIDFL